MSMNPLDPLKHFQLVWFFEVFYKMRFIFRIIYTIEIIDNGNTYVDKDTANHKNTNTREIRVSIEGR